MVVKLVGKAHEILQNKQAQGGGSSVKKGKQHSWRNSRKNANREAAFSARKHYDLSLYCLDNIIMNNNSICINEQHQHTPDKEQQH
jgi:hypothetical protein